jgi:hypothetical protein
MNRGLSLLVVAVLAATVACSADPSGPSRTELAGTYRLTELRFDPQGTLTEVELLSRMTAANVPRLVLAPGGEAQLIFEDPATGLVTTSDGVYSTPQVGARIDFGTGTAYRAVLLSRRMTFTYSAAAGTLSFDAVAPDGVDRARLRELAPEWADEQLLDPVPGELTAVFTRVP